MQKIGNKRCYFMRSTRMQSGC